jgi:hypothetical protein
MSRARNQTQWHRLLGKLLEELLTPVGVAVYTDFPIMSDPPAADILLLRRDSVAWTPAQQARLPDGVRDCQARHILLEFKYTESLNEMALRQALAYDTFYKRIQRLKDAEVQTFLLSAKTPSSSFLTEFGYRRGEHSGVYYSQSQLVQVVPVLSLNELRNDAHNLFVRFFASQRQQKAAAFGGLQALDQTLLAGQLYLFLAGLRLYWFEREDAMKSKPLTMEEVLALGEEWGKRYLNTLPPAERLAGLPPAERVAGLAAEEILDLLPLEKIEAYLNQAKKGRKGKRNPSATRNN